MAPSHAGLLSDVEIAAPHAAPLMVLHASGPGLVRSGTNGILSTSSSVTAKSAALRENAPAPIAIRDDPPTRTIPCLAAHVRMAGAIIDRIPATTPIAAGKAKLVKRLIYLSRTGNTESRITAEILTYLVPPRKVRDSWTLPMPAGQSATCSDAGKWSTTGNSS